MGQICLCKDIVYETGLTYSEAAKILDIVAASPASKMITFSIVGDAGTDPNSWRVVGTVDSLVRDFLDNPKNYIVTIPD